MTDQVTPTDSAESQSEANDRSGTAFFQFIKAKGKPGLVSFMGNAYRIKAEADGLTFLFDRKNANLIPMLKSPNHMAQLEDLIQRFFTEAKPIHFAVGKDPKLAQEAALKEEALAQVQANPAVRFILDQFNGKIVHCEIVEETKE